MQSGPCRLALKPSEPTGNFRAAYAAGLDVAIRVGCTDEATLASCLRNTAPTEIIAAQAEIAPVRDLGFAIGEFLPLIDGVVLTQPLTDAIAAGASDVPIIVGSNREDASFFAAGEIGSDDFAAYLDRVFPANRDTLLAMYPPAALTELGAATIFITDIAFACEAERLAEAAASGSPAYLYELNRGMPSGPLAPFLAVHGVDFLYLFASYASFGSTPGTASIEATVQQAWAALAAGEPPTTTPAWPASDVGFLEIDETNTTSTDWRGGRCASLRTLGLTP